MFGNDKSTFTKSQIPTLTLCLIDFSHLSYPILVPPFPHLRPLWIFSQEYRPLSRGRWGFWVVRDSDSCASKLPRTQGLPLDSEEGRIYHPSLLGCQSLEPPSTVFLVVRLVFRDVCGRGKVRRGVVPHVTLLSHLFCPTLDPVLPVLSRPLGSKSGV